MTATRPARRFLNHLRDFGGWTGLAPSLQLRLRPKVGKKKAEKKEEATHGKRSADQADPRAEGEDQGDDRSGSRRDGRVVAEVDHANLADFLTCRLPDLRLLLVGQLDPHFVCHGLPPLSFPLSFSLLWDAISIARRGPDRSSRQSPASG